MALLLDDPAAPQDDVLGRSELANTIYSLIKDAPKDWTLRIGVYGRWGEGKTTILDLVTGLAKADAMPVARFNPSLAGNESSLWGSLFLSITDALGETRRRTGTQRGEWKWRRARAKFASKAAGVLKVIEDAHPMGKALSRFSDLAGESLWSKIRISAEDVADLLKTELGDKRLIIIVDDVDRLEPALVPRLLLTFRDIDMPSGAFIVAVDPDVVTQGLEEVHPGWKNAPEFLEKILQFHYWLAPPDEPARLRLARQQIPGTKLDIPVDVLNEIATDLPKNPRKLKEFFRSLWQLSPIVRRHRPDDVNWMLLLLLELLRAEAPLLVDSLLTSEAFRQHMASSTFFEKTSDEKMQTQNREEIDRDLDAVLDKSQTALRARLLQIVRRIGDAPLTTADAINYWAHIRDRPPAVTPKEAAELQGAWTIDPTLERLSELLRDHARQVNVTLPRVAREVFQQTIALRHEQISRATDSAVVSELQTYMSAADSLLDFLSTMIEDLHVFSDPAFEFESTDFMQLCSEFSAWAHFTNRPEYRDARDRERRLLLVAGSDASRMAADLLNELREAYPLPGREEEAKRLRGELMDVLKPFVIDDIQARFERPEGILTLGGRRAARIEGYLLNSPEAGVYTPEFIEKLKTLAVRAKTDTAVQKNFIEMIRIVGNTYTGGDPQSEQAKRRFVPGVLKGIDWRVGPLRETVEVGGLARDQGYISGAVASLKCGTDPPDPLDDPTKLWCFNHLGPRYGTVGRAIA
jgi:hypothetical protein